MSTLTSIINPLAFKTLSKNDEFVYDKDMEDAEFFPFLKA